MSQVPNHSDAPKQQARKVSTFQDSQKDVWNVLQVILQVICLSNPGSGTSINTNARPAAMPTYHDSQAYEPAKEGVHSPACERDEATEVLAAEPESLLSSSSVALASSLAQLLLLGLGSSRRLAGSVNVKQDLSRRSWEAIPASKRDHEHDSFHCCPDLLLHIWLSDFADSVDRILSCHKSSRPLLVQQQLLHCPDSGHVLEHGMS